MTILGAPSYIIYSVNLKISKRNAFNKRTFYIDIIKESVSCAIKFQQSVARKCAIVLLTCVDLLY